MEKSILTFFALFLIQFALCQEIKREFEYTEGDTTYTMKQYVFCLYLSGTERSQTQEEAAQLQEAHLKYIDGMTSKGLLMAGPFGDDTEKRGVLLFDLETVEEAEALVNEDPMVKGNRLTFECHPLWLAKGTRIN